MWPTWGAYYFQLQEFEAALTSLEEAQTLLATGPASSEETLYRSYYQSLILAIKGLSQYRLGNYKAALNTLEQAITIGELTTNPYGEGAAYFFQGIVLVEQGDWSGGAMSHRRAVDRLAAAERSALQFEVLLELGNAYWPQASNDLDEGRYDAAIAIYQQTMGAYQEAFELSQSLAHPNYTARALNEISSSFVIIGHTYYAAADQAFTNGKSEAAYEHIAAAIVAIEQGVQSALEALALVASSSDEDLIQYIYENTNIAHIALGQVYELQAILLQTEEQYEASLAAYQSGLTWYEAGLPYAIASGNPNLLAYLRLNIALSYEYQARSHSILRQYDAGIVTAQASLEVARQIPSRDSELSALQSLQDLYFDSSEVAENAGDFEQAIRYAEQSLAYARQSLSLAEQKLQVRSEIPGADALLDRSIIDTEAERQDWIEFALQQIWLSAGQLGFLHDVETDFVNALEHYQEALAAAERLDELGLVASILGPISGVYVQRSQYPEALAVQERIADIASQTNDTELWFASTLGIASIYDDLGRYPEAIAAYEQMYALAQEQGRLAKIEIALNNLGVIYTFQGNYDIALENFNQALTSAQTIRAQLEAPDGLTKLDEYCDLASIQVIEPAEADATVPEDVHDVALSAFNDLLDAESAEYARRLCIDSTWDTEQKQLNNTAVVYTDQGRYREAIAFYEQSLAINQTWGTLLDRATTLNNMGNTYLHMGEYDTALEIYQEALAIRKTIDNPSGLAFSLNNLGSAYRLQGRYAEALAAYQEALTIVQDIGLKPSEVALRGNLGTVYAEQGRYDDAQAHYEASLTLAQALERLPDQAFQFSHLSDLATKRGNYPQALDYAEQALTIYRDIGVRIGERTALEQLGNVYRAQGNFADALARHEEALALAQTLGDQDDEAYALLALGKTYLQLGQYKQATQFYQAGLSTFRNIGSVIGEANALRFLGNVAIAQAQPAEALSLYEQALAIYQNSGSVTGEHLTLIDMGFAQRQLGNLAMAETTLEEALAIQQQIGAQANEGVTLVGLALVRHEQETPRVALNLLQEALALHQELGDRPNEAATLSDIGQLLVDQDQPELAITFLKQSVNLYESIRGDLRALDTDLQASYTDSVADTYRTLADLLLSQNRILEAQRVLDLLKIQELDEYFQDVQRSAETAPGVDFWQVETDLLALYQEVLEQTAELQALEAKSVDTLTDAEQQRLRDLQTVRDEAEGWFYDFLDDPTVVATVDQIRANSRGQNLEPENFPDLANNLRLLPQKTAALYPLILEDRLELVLVMPEGPPLRYPVAVSAQELNQGIVRFGQALKTPSSNIEPLAQKLYGWLVEPLSEQLEQVGIEALIYAPDGALRYIPLAALHDGEQYLAERFSISHITAASLTDLNVPPRPQDRQLLAAACADCEFTINVGDTEFDFPDLPFTEVEVNTLAEQVPGVDILLNQEFNAAALQNLSRYDVVHLATHAAFVAGSPDESFIVFGSGETINLRNIKREWTLDNTELVVLSACETAVGSTDLGTGIEILGLGYRLEQAGAQATVASLWQVSDGGTQKLMQAFYAGLQQGMGKSEALQAAQQAMIRGEFSAMEGSDRGLGVVPNEASDRAAPNGNALAHPYYWAPFILIGNGL